ncbi:MAG: 2-C-methyl-D-erythritol 4-phosphate cytidylyltransferase [Bacteroidales bacterium]|nr:2-C-methyl-D-erythritol 4-phosphate cytidylyltransferase [Bacteroidales bacterium]
MKCYVLIMAAGSGSRFGAEIPKQFHELAGKPVVMHAIQQFLNWRNDIEIIIVLPAGYLTYWKNLTAKYSFNVPHSVTEGGATRFLSVRNGLALTGDDGLVAVHDGVRPLVSTDTITRCFETAEKYGSAVPVINPADTVRLETEQSSTTFDRNRVKLVQTPQVFRADIIRKAYMQDYNPGFTDDATVVEKSGIAIHLVEGNRENIKITNPEDLAVAGALLHYIF